MKASTDGHRRYLYRAIDYSGALALTVDDPES